MLSAIETLLETQFNVKSVLDYADIDKKASGRPVVLYVLPLGERVSNTEYTGVTVSRVTHQIGVVIALRSVRDAQDGERQRRIETERDKVRLLLAGWAPRINYEPLTRGNGRLLKFRNNTVYWLDVFETKVTEEARHHN